MEIGVVRKVDIDQEMQQSYLDYAMSVIVARALPDARDGLKPVQRRILYALYDMGLTANSGYKKSARIVGEVLGKYHPHGDMAVYESMARLAQTFSMRYLLVDGQGNFGSVDGDPPAAMRYTEARLAPFAMELLSQIDRNTVDFVPNFDQSLVEPDVLPAAMPNLLVNGASGIAVGMATNIPPHNLGEVVDALAFMLKEWDHLDDIGVSDLMKFVQGPDFPTGGIIVQEGVAENGLVSAYATGKGKITVRGRVHVEDTGRGRNRIIISELPYMVNKSALIERIADLVRDGHLEGIADLRDESDRQGMRIVIDLNKAAETESVLRDLYRHTPLQSSFGINLLALVGGEPHLLNLKQALKVYLEHRIEVIKRRSQYDLEKARQRAHILEGLRIALKNLDEIIALIRGSSDVETARQKLIKKYTLSEVQAQAILDMPLRRLAALERKKIEQEYKELQTLIKGLETLLKSPVRMREVVQEELAAMRQTYADRRRTQIVSLKEGESATQFLTTTDLTPEQSVWVGVSDEGQIGRTLGEELPRVSGREAPARLLRTNTHHTLLLVAQDGQAAALAVHALPQVERFADGAAINKASPLPAEAKVAAMVSMPAASEIMGEKFIITVTRQGMVKKSSVLDLPGPSTQSFALAKVNNGDEMVTAFLSDGLSEIGLLTQRGYMIRFGEGEVRAMGLVAAGVMGIKLAEGDSVIAAWRWADDLDLLLLASNGVGWHLDPKEISPQGRYGQGTMACKLPPEVSLAAGGLFKRTETALVLFQKAAARNLKPADIVPGKRLSAGKAVFEVKAKDGVAGWTRLDDGQAFWEVKPPTRKRRK